MGKTLTGVIIKLLSSKINLNSSPTREQVPFASMYKVNKPANFKNSEFLKESGIIQFPGSKSEFYKLELLNPTDKFQFYKYNSSISNDSYNLKNSVNFLEEKVSLFNKSFTLNTNPFLPEVQMKSLDSMDYLENVI